MTDINSRALPGIQEAVVQGLKIILVPSAESLSHYECLGLDDDGDLLDMPEPKFLDTAGVSREVQEAIETNLFTPIERISGGQDYE